MVHAKVTRPFSRKYDILLYVFKRYDHCSNRKRRRRRERESKGIEDEVNEDDECCPI